VGFTASNHSKLLNLTLEVEDLVNVWKQLDSQSESGDGTGVTWACKDDGEGFFEPATYVNLFRVQNIFNKAFNAEFWYNNGSLKGDELLGQIIHLICCMVTAGLTPMSQCSMPAVPISVFSLCCQRSKVQ
jgi:hypothetical protein